MQTAMLFQKVRSKVIKHHLQNSEIGNRKKLDFNDIYIEFHNNTYS